MAQQTGVMPAELDEPELPGCVAHLWHLFLELDSQRGGGFGPAPIGYPQLAAWQRVSGVSLTPWEAGALLAMDNAALHEMST